MTEPPTPNNHGPSDPSGPNPSVEQQLRLAEQRLTFHVENTPLAVIEWDDQMRVTRWNSQAERMFGWTAAEVIGKSPLEWRFILDDNRPLADRMRQDAEAGRLPHSVVTVQNYTKSGKIVWCEWYTSVLSDDSGQVVSALSLVLDVTEKRATAEALSLSQARMLAALDSAKMLAWDLDLVTSKWETTVDIPDFYGIERGLDYTNPELALQVVHPDDVSVIMAGRQRAIETGEPMQYEFRGRLPSPDGQPRWFATRGRVLRDEAGKAVRIVAVTTDITDRKRAEEKFRALLESAPDAMLIVDEEGRITLVNTQTEKLFGYPREELLGQMIEILVPEANRQRHPSHRGAYMKTPQTRPMGTNRELAGRRKDGSTFPVEVSLSPLAVGSEKYVISAVRDVSERKQTEAEREVLNRQLQDAQRWESLGVLAGGVAHDFNNILTVVLGSAGLARRGLPLGSPAIGYLEQIEQASRRAADVCRQMLAYAGHTPSSGGRVDLAALVRESAPLLEIPAGRTPVAFHLIESTPVIQADPAQVRQVLVNLVTNAAEAIGGKEGEIGVRVHVCEVSSSASDAGFPLAPPPGQYVVLTVSDNGCGISPEVRLRMFDPFFTTKFAGRGLGLAAVLGIVRAHKGGIHVLTAPGQGTTISVYWPVVPISAPALGEQRARPTVAALIVDDEMFVREVTASTLEEMGFAPLLAADGPSGIDLFRKHRDTIKLAVIDVMMPGMTGDQVLEAIRALEPSLPVVLVSGFTDRRVIKTTFSARTEFLQKPFHPEELMELVRRMV